VSSDPVLDPATENGPLLVVITGPSGVGKDTVLARLRELAPGAHVTVTATTRPKRQTETEGVDYYFISPEAYAEMLARGEFLEHATVYGYGYGIPRAPIRKALAEGVDVLVRIDVQGAATIGEFVPGSVRIFLAPPSFDELERRLRERKLDAPEVIERRLRTAREEMARAAECEYVVVNADGLLDETVCRIVSIMAAERARVRRRRVEV
jgi:guanylate kinase